jgi:ATP-dependent helicase/nuclease subunit B
MIVAGSTDEHMPTPTRIELITGPAGSGKTERCLAAYRDALRRSLGTGRPAAVLWIAPTELSRRAVLSSLCDDSLPVAFAPNVETFASLSKRVLESSPVRGLDPAVKRRVLRQLIDEAHGAGRLGGFAAIAGTSGFLDLVDGFISELKRAEIWPDEFAAVCRKIGDREKDHVMGELYERYQQRLLETNLYDDEGKFWSARDVLSRDLGPFAGRELIVVDGFTDFTRTQREMLALLAAGCQSLRITLPLEKPLRRTDLFAKSGDALERLRESLKPVGDVTVVALDGESATVPAMRHISRELFRNPRDVSRSADAGGIRVLAVTGANAEVDVVAHRVKTLLLAGTEPADVVVAVRSMDAVADLWRSRFAAAGIPFWCSAGFPLLREPIVRSLLEVLRLELEDWPFERLKAVLLSNYFRPGWKSNDLPSRVSRLLQFLRKQKLHRHRRIIANHAKEDEIIRRIDAALMALRSDADFAGWVDRLTALAGELGISTFSRDSESSERSDPLRKASESRPNERDREAWNRLKSVLYDAVDAAKIAGADDGKMLLTEFADAAVELLQSQELSSANDRQGRVWIVEAQEVRSLDVPHLFLAGLTEQSFPRNRGDDCLYLERERREFHKHGLDIRHRTSQSQDEMLLFYGVVTRARQSLTLSYPEVGSNGQALFCSPYLTSLLQLFEPEALRVEPVGGLDPVPPREQVLTPADWRTVAVEESLAGRPGLFRAFADVNASTARSILAGVDANAARFATVGWTEYDGELRRAACRKSLKERYPDDYQFSASQFESYAYCRFRFFLDNVLHVEPLESPAVATDYMGRGNLVHDALADLHRELLQSAGAETSADLAARFREKVEARIKAPFTDTDLAVALNEIERRLVTGWADAYAAQAAAYQTEIGESWDEPPRPARLELPFGNVAEAASFQPGSRIRENSAVEKVPFRILTNSATPTDAGSVGHEFGYATFGSQKNATRIRGRIDRIDVGVADGKTVFNVIDYKTGKPPRFSLEEVQSGTALQLALYTLAVMRLEIAGPDAKPFQMGYWAIRETGFVPGMKSRGKTAALEDSVLAELEATLDELIPRLAAGIRSGHFPVDSEDPHCTDRCPYRTVCRITQLRPIRERLQKLREKAP